MIIFVTKSWLERKKICKGEGREGAKGEKREERKTGRETHKERDRRRGGKEGREGRKEGRASSKLSPRLLGCWCVITVISNRIFFST